jgi:ABC-type uncharacterized transport system permease subunit
VIDLREMSGILLYPLTALLYGALAFYYWRTQWRTPAQNTPQSRSASPAHYYTLLPLALHTWTLSHSAFAPDGLHLGFGVAVSAILWLTVLIYWLGNFFYRLDGLQALVMPLAALGVLLPLLAPEPRPLPNTELFAFRIHLLIAIVAYSLFTIASLHVLLMTLLERHLHQGGMPIVLQRLPPLLTMEAMLFRILWTGFVLLTLTLVTGVLFSEELFGKAAKFNHKTVFGFASWLIFAALLGGRYAYGWRGRVAVRWTLAGFFTLVLAYIGSKFVLQVILGRP